MKSTIDFSKNEDVSYQVSILGLWCIAEMIAGFFVLCLPSVPRIFTDSLVVKRLVTYLRGFYGSGSNLPEERSGRSSRTWSTPRSKPTQWSLFTDSDERSFALLPDEKTSELAQIPPDIIPDEESKTSTSYEVTPVTPRPSNC
jgi:hypothetical protein